jgi:hypothetical protein
MKDLYAGSRMKDLYAATCIRAPTDADSLAITLDRRRPFLAPVRGERGYKSQNPNASTATRAIDGTF